jgi:hypothetical protein
MVALSGRIRLDAPFTTVLQVQEREDIAKSGNEARLSFATSRSLLVNATGALPVDVDK